MGRLCERPGCSEAASVAYGMRPEDLVFWLDVLRDGTDPAHGVLCRRHADSMVVPRHWTLDDLRDPDLHLFRPPAPLAATATTRRRRARATVEVEQLPLDPNVTSAPSPDVADGGVRAEPVSGGPVDTDPDDDVVPWTPTFDEHDDLDGLLSARSPLLARAFRGDDRPRAH